MVFYEIISWIFFICLTKKKQNKKICNEVRRFIRQNILNWPLLVFFYVSHVIIINFGTTYHGCRTPCNIRSWCAVPKTRKYFKISFKIKVYKLDKSPKSAFFLKFFLAVYCVVYHDDFALFKNSTFFNAVYRSNYASLSKLKL